MPRWVVTLRIAESSRACPHPGSVVSEGLAEFRPTLEVLDGELVMTVSVDGDSPMSAEWQIVHKLEERGMFGLARIVASGASAGISGAAHTSTPPVDVREQRTTSD